MLVTFLLAYVAVIVLLLLFENRLIFFPQIPGRLSGDWSPPDLPVEDVWLKTQDGVRLNAWWIPAVPPSGTNQPLTFLSFHGNAANIAWRADFYRFLRQLGANVLAVEYRGYGRSEGRPSEGGIYSDADAAYEYLVGVRGIPAGSMIAIGQSLGTAVAADLASRREVGGVVLEAPFPSARSLARRVYWFLPGLPWLIRSRFETSKKLEVPAVAGRRASPLLVIHCTGDPVIPFDLGKEVYDRAPQPKSFVAIRGECHEEAFLVDPGTLRRELERFIEQIRARAAP
jgi:fermentation-respiration switch protein FrsA (DUF1100 family)